MRVRGGEQHCETDASNQRHGHVADTAQLCPIGDPTDSNCQSGSTGVRWDGQKLGLCAFVTHGEKDSREEERENVQWAKATHVDDSIPPGLPVAKGGKYMSTVDASNLGAGLSIQLESAYSS
jgi:hypothetical protein